MSTKIESQIYRLAKKNNLAARKIRNPNSMSEGQWYLVNFYSNKIEHPHRKLVGNRCGLTADDVIEYLTEPAAGN